MTIDDIKAKSIPILKKYGITKSDIFGSFARGDNDEDSDVDFLIETPSETSLFGIIRLKDELEAELGREVDLVSYKYVNKRVKKYVFENISRVI